jgi:altronate dehydratase
MSALTRKKLIKKMELYDEYKSENNLPMLNKPSRGTPPGFILTVIG